MKKCKVHLCGNKISDTMSVFQIPSNVPLRVKWFEFLTQSGCSDLNSNGNYFICEKHFKKDQIMVSPMSKRKKLVQDAVPTIFDSNSEVNN